MNQIRVLKESVYKILTEKKSLEESFSHLHVLASSKEEEESLKKDLLFLLRHYRTLSFETLNLAPFKEGSDGFLFSLVSLSLLREGKNEDHSKEYASALKEMGSKEDPSALYVSFKKETLTPFKIPEEVKSSPNYYPSLLFEMPEFLFRRLASDYGREAAFRIASASHKKNAFYYESYKEGENPASLKEISLSPFDTIEESDTPLKGDIKSSYFPVSYIKSLGASTLPLPPLNPNILLLSPRSFALPLHFALKTRDSFKATVDVTVDSLPLYRKLMDVHYQERVEGLHVLPVSPKLAKTLLSFDSYDAVIYEGEDLGLGRSKSHPEVFVSLEEKDFALSYQRQLASLVEAAQFVKPGSYLLFVNNGIEKEETTKIKEAFLQREKKFTLKEEKLLLPSESKQEAGYYALFQKGIKA